MIAIIDGGSTKCDWSIINDNGNEISRFSTLGFNPNNITSEKIDQELQKLNTENIIPPNINEIYFYGAGCGNEGNRNILKNCLKNAFPNSKITVKEDTFAAAYAVYSGKPTLVGILGTGSNSCFFDGKNIRLDLPSFGYIIGDEGSGTAIGKAIIKDFFMKKFPKDLEYAFKQKYQLDFQTTINKIYHEPRPNAFFASFNPFALEHKEHPHIKKLLKTEFNNYINYQILPYPEAKTHTLSFVGSIAKLYEDILKETLQEHNIKLGNIIQKPIDSLIKYHIEHII